MTMMERDLERTVADMCRLYRVHRFHAPDSRMITAGWPDDVILGPYGVLFRELKTDRGRLTKEQNVILGLLDAAGLDTAVWRPSDLTTGVIQKEIAAISERKES